MQITFKNREDASDKLVLKLEKYRNNRDAIVLGLARGGVVPAHHIAKILGLPMDIFVTRKIGAPGSSEFAIGAVDETGKGFFNDKIIAEYDISKEYINEETEKMMNEAKRRMELYRGERTALNLKEKIAIIVDDGVATGATMKAAIKSAKIKGAKKVVVAVPVIALDTAEKIKTDVDELVYLDAPYDFSAVGQFYEFFPQVSDDEVVRLMEN